MLRSAGKDLDSFDPLISSEDNKVTSTGTADAAPFFDFFDEHSIPSATSAALATLGALHNRDIEAPRASRTLGVKPTGQDALISAGATAKPSSRPSSQAASLSALSSSWTRSTAAASPTTSAKPQQNRVRYTVGSGSSVPRALGTKPELKASSSRDEVDSDRDARRDASWSSKGAVIKGVVASSSSSSSSLSPAGGLKAGDGGSSLRARERKNLFAAAFKSKPKTQQTVAAKVEVLPLQLPKAETDQDAPPVRQLCGMGFTREEALAALEKSGYDFSKALNMLLS